MYLEALAEFKPAASSRAWLSAPHPSRPLIATACADKTVRVYSLQNFTLHSTLDGGHKRSIRSVAWKPHQPPGSLALVTGSFDATAGLWRRDESAKREQNYTADEEEEEHDWEFSLVLEGHDSEIKSVAFSPSGQYLATCSRDKSVWIWEEIGEEGDDEWETVAVLQEHDGDVKCIAWCGDDGKSEILASASYDDTVRLWREDEEREWGCVAILQQHQGTVWAVDWEGVDYPGRKELLAPVADDATSDEEPFHPPRLLTCSADESIRVWQREITGPQQRIPSGRDLIPSTMRMSFNSGEKWHCVATLPKAHEGDIYSVSWSPRTGRVVSTGSDSKIVVYEEQRLANAPAAEQLEQLDKAQINGDETTDKDCCGGSKHEETSGGCCGGKSRSAGSCCGGKGHKETEPSTLSNPTEWRVLASIAQAHGPFEVNHVAWSKRFDEPAAADDEMIVSTGDDGSVVAWKLVDGDGASRHLGRATDAGLEDVQDGVSPSV